MATETKAVIGTITWTEAGRTHTAIWRAENGAQPPKRLMVVDDTISADSAYRLACEGTGLLWRGDYQNARQLLLALARRVDAKSVKTRRYAATAANRPASNAEHAKLLIDAFNRHRLSRSQRARTLSMLLIPFDSDFSVPLGRAPEVQTALKEAWGQPTNRPSVASLRELLGIIGAHEWRRKGVEIAALGERIHPHYGVFAPIRSEYVGLVAKAPLPTPTPVMAFDIGTGTGVLAAVLSNRGISRVIATDMDSRALICARDNLRRLGLQETVSVIAADLFPQGRAPLIVCNPPWLPARPSSPLERAVYDPDSNMLRGFLSGLAAHMEPGGEGWLILSDLAEHLGLRSRETLLSWIAESGLMVRGRIDIKPSHPRISDTTDALHAARAKEVTSLWRLSAT
ncbi:MAG: methyltransferase [Burkholderiales bacterium]|nr:class I SAM-dependent methyltransferase [Betaproteobacteria bacterium]